MASQAKTSHPRHGTRSDARFGAAINRPGGIARLSGDCSGEAGFAAGVAANPCFAL